MKSNIQKVQNLNYNNMKKKIAVFIAVIGMITLQSCTSETVVVPDPVDNDTISEVFEYSTNVNFVQSNNYQVMLNFPYTILSYDMVLVYRLTGFNSAQGDFWKLLPETYYFPDGTLDYGFKNEFTRNNTLVTLYGYDLEDLNPSVRLNQVIRVVVIPGFRANKTAHAVDLKDYNAVIHYYQIDTKNITKINLK